MFASFRRMQTTVKPDSTQLAASKKALRDAMRRLADRLDRYLAGQYGLDVPSVAPGSTGGPSAKDKKASVAEEKFQHWRATHQPFHWITEFYGIMSHSGTSGGGGGFDAIIGNPPYVEYSKVRREYGIMGFTTESCGNLYAMCTERSFDLLHSVGRFGFIVQAPIVSTQRMAAVRALLCRRADFLACSTFDDRPAKLFDGMHHCRLAIVLARRSDDGSLEQVHTTRYHKWYEEERDQLFQSLAYLRLPAEICRDLIPKLRSNEEIEIYRRIQDCPSQIGNVLSPKPTPHRIYYKITGVGHWFTFTVEPPKFWRDGTEGRSSKRELQ